MKKVRVCSRRSDTIAESRAKWGAEKKRKETEIKKLWNSPSLSLSHCRHYLNSGNNVKKHRFLLLIIAELCTDHFL